MHGFAGAGHSQRWDKDQIEAFSLEEMRQRAVIVAGGLEGHAHRMLETMQIIGKAAELNGGVQQNQTLTVLQAGGFDEDFMAQLGNIDGYQDRGRLRTLNNGHGWLGS